MITIYYFACLKDLTGRESECLPVSSIRVKELLEWASRTYEGFPTSANATQVAINEEYAHIEDEIQAGDVVAFIPPVSGG